ncbi:hypothetical protein GCM10008018_47420 [Paenibacillus marchantiophytorum]|uniref:Uncharacterized protein n=1 Tax=Paenibacillus marchantiophytorum TaxID=1619310 RepID=A0ABQ1F0Z8_9BACL|nr:hypothetical protein GCM10008018_47420 [Paenibacillus marchantiophytorum]
MYFEDMDTSLLKQKTKTEYFQYVDTNFTAVPCAYRNIEEYSN